MPIAVGFCIQPRFHAGLLFSYTLHIPGPIVNSTMCESCNLFTMLYNIYGGK